MTFLEPPIGVIGAPTRGLRGLGVSAPPVDPNFQRNLTTLTNKYTEFAPLIQQLPDPVRNSLINYDSRRVAFGGSPMTRRQTALAIQTALSNQQATPEPERNPLNVLGNFRADLSDILKAIPRLPLAAFNEVRDIGNIGAYMQQAQQLNKNPLTTLLQAPGVRLIPGTYVAGSVLEGREGLQQLATHPLMAALDVLPIASRAAATTRVGRLAGQAREAQGLRPRPLSAVLTSRVAPSGVDLQRNTLGQVTDMFRNETSIGRALDAFGGTRSRMVSRMAGTKNQRYRAFLADKAIPATDVETYLPRVRQIFERYADEYPMFKQDRSVAGPEWDIQRRQFFEDIQRQPDKYNPALVNEIRDFNYDVAKYQEAQGNLRQFDNEWYPTAIGDQLMARESAIAHAQRMVAYRNEYLNPSGQLTVDQFRAMADDVAAESKTNQRSQAIRAFEATADAYNIDITPIRSARAAIETRKGTINDWRTTVDSVLSDPTLTLAPRRTVSDIVSELKPLRLDRQGNLLEAAVRYGQRHETTARLKNIYSRKRGTQLDPTFRDDARSMSRRREFDNKVGRLFTDERLARKVQRFEQYRATQAPARFQALIEDARDVQAPGRLTSTAEQSLVRALSPQEAAQVVTAVQRKLWDDVPGVSREQATQVMTQLEREVAATWQQLRAAGHDPVFVHKVSPARANQALSGNIGPVPVKQTATKERVLDMSPAVGDVQVSMTHQAGEMLLQRYSEDFVEQVMDAVGKTEAQLRAELQDAVIWRMGVDPSLDFDGHLQQIIKRQYEKFNPEEAGTAWGGVRLDKYKQQDYYIPRAVADNLHRYAKPPSILTSLTDPFTKAFRYNVIGLSPSVIINNFFSNSVALAAESGVRPWRNWNMARDWLRNPERIPNEELKGMILAEIPNMESLNRDAWLASRTGQRFMASFNGGKAFQDSVFSRTAGTAKQKLDAVVSKSLSAQRWGDNIYRAMQYMDELEKGIAKGKDATVAANHAMELVRRTFVDYASFTPIERSAMRTLVPFYSYMGHAARFIARYPLDHPMRASIAASLAAAEKERLGALPGSFLSMVPLPFTSMDAQGKQNMLALRPFDPFGDISDLMSVAGWMSAMNPLIQTGLQQVGVIRGEAELYPTLRYDPETGRMRAARGNLLSDLFHNTMPRAGLITSLIGLNPAQNELRARDPDAANRALVSMAGLPRAWRGVDVPWEQFQAEIARDRAATDVRNEAFGSGNWREARRYPSLRGYFEALQQLPDDVVQRMTPQTQEAVAQQITDLVG